MTGLYCPGCGTLRALHDILHGDVVGALGHNALTIPVLAALLGWALWALLPRPGSGGGPVPPTPARGSEDGTIRSRGRPWVPLLVSSAILVTFTVFTVARNLPGSPLAP